MVQKIHRWSIDGPKKANIATNVESRYNFLSKLYVTSCLLPSAFCFLLTFNFMDHFRNWFFPIRTMNFFFLRCFLAPIEPISYPVMWLCVCARFCVIIKLDRYYDLSFQINVSKNIIQINGTQQTFTKLDIKRTQRYYGFVSIIKQLSNIGTKCYVLHFFHLLNFFRWARNKLGYW